MLLRRVALTNVRSFLDHAELKLEGNISIIIGPNGGGKTNLLDSIVIMLRRYLFASMYAAHAPSGELHNRYEFRPNDMFNQLVLEKHSSAPNDVQVVEVEIEITQHDCDSMVSIKRDAAQVIELSKTKYHNLKHRDALNWDINLAAPGVRLIYRLNNGNLEHGETTPLSVQFLQYLQVFEMDSQLREEYGLAALATPMIYLPVNRAANSITSSVELAGYNPYEQKKQSDISISRTQFSLVQLAIGRLAEKYRLLLERDSGAARTDFNADPNIVEFTRFLERLGYHWELTSTAPLKNAYDVSLTKQGKTFAVSRASSGERELLTYLFTIFALNVRDALIIVDEPELHLHPKWQAILLELFSELSATTGNQFLLATHSPRFVSPESIQYVSRVFSEQQKSNILRLDVATLPDRKHIFKIVNSQNNERIFFADKVLLVEGITDQIFVEAALKELRLPDNGLILEVVSIGGKGLFSAYDKLLSACGVAHAKIADLDYVEQIGGSELAPLFQANAEKIKKDVLQNPKSYDGAAIISSIDAAFASGSLEDAAEQWAYIKRTRLKLTDHLTPDQVQMLDNFVSMKRTQNIFLLRRGALEQYLPEGFASKDVDKLIRFVGEPGFLAKIDPEAWSEIEGILRQACRID